jgi:hypothetical protein
MKLPLTGGCGCGAIRYEISQPPVEVYACHCTDCQRFTGSAFSIGVVVLDAAFRLTGKDAQAAPSHVAASGRLKTRRICPDCGSWTYGMPRPGPQGLGMIRILRGGTLDDTSWLRPTTHFWTRSKQAWVTLPVGSASHDTQPDRG